MTTDTQTASASLWRTDSPLVIAEVAGAHQGDLETAKRIISEAKSSGADFIKFQKFIPQELVCQSHPKWDHFHRIGFSDIEWDSILRHASSQEIPVIMDVFDCPSLIFLQNYTGIYAFKIHSSDLENDRLIAAVVATGKPLILGVGGSRMTEIWRALDLIANFQTSVLIMAGFQAFPTAIEDLNLNQIGYLRETTGCVVGYADHVDADSSDAQLVPLLAIGSGAWVIEKHITLDRSQKGIDYFSALNPSEFSHLAKTIRHIYPMFGAGRPLIGPAEKKYRETMKKGLVAATHLRPGIRILESDIQYKRVPSGLQISDRAKILGKVLTVEKAIDAPLKWSDFSPTVIVCIVARMNSTRLPEKAVRAVNGMPAIVYLIRRLKKAKRPAELVLCTSTHPQDRILIYYAEQEGIKWVTGDPDDVLSRLIKAADQFHADIVVRATGDDILVDSEIMDELIDRHIEAGVDYTFTDDIPKGMETEVISTTALKSIRDRATDTRWTEYLTWYLKIPEVFDILDIKFPEFSHSPKINLTMDILTDYELIQSVVDELSPGGEWFSVADVIQLFKKHPEWHFRNSDRPTRALPKMEIRLSDRLTQPKIGEPLRG